MADTPSLEEIEAARTPAGGWTKEILASWGVPWPPPRGWRLKLAGHAPEPEPEPISPMDPPW